MHRIRQIGKGVGGMAGDSRGLWCDFEKFFHHFFLLNASGRNAIVQSRYKSSDSMALSFSAKVFSECAKVWHKERENLSAVPFSAKQ